MQRLLQPLLRENKSYQPVTFETALHYLVEIGTNSHENDTLVMSNGNYSNEVYYLLQRLARTGLKTNALSSFDYYNRGTAFFFDKNDIVPFAELFGSSLFVCLFDPTENAPTLLSTTQILDACHSASQYFFNTPTTLHIQDYTTFFRSLNYYLLQKNLAKGIYINGLGKNLETYKEKLLSEDFDALLKVNNLQEYDIQRFINTLQATAAPVFIVWERMLSERGIIELENLCMLLDIQAKPSSGFLSIKADLNSQGLFDMGFFPDICVGGQPFTPELKSLMRNYYHHSIYNTSLSIVDGIRDGKFRNCLIMNNTNEPLPVEISDFLSECPRKILQTAYWEENQGIDYDLIIPASIPEEEVGTFTDTTRIPHTIKAVTKCSLPYNTLQQLNKTSELFGLPKLDNPESVFLEYISFFRTGCQSEKRHFFR